MTWRDQAACRDGDPALFVPAGPRPIREAYERLALAVCARCPVTEPCLREAVERGEQGTWGNTTTEERRKRYGPPHGTRARYVGHPGRKPCRCQRCTEAAAASSREYRQRRREAS